VDAILAACERGLLRDLDAPDLPGRLADLEPESQVRHLDDTGIDQLAGAFADVIDAKSPFTGSHSRRVSSIADALAGRLGVGASARVQVRRAGLLHDVGKLGVPNRILDKPGRLEPDELALVRRHPELALGILGGVPRFHEVAELAACHHERLDGTGYFRGLGAASLGVGARIIAVADVFEALTADRPYRPAMDTDSALSLMRRDAGDHLAHEVLEQLPHVLAEG
jgi:HD-GYP domain-containing protein (c-di-GMP phosphodiesterase class II)